MPLNLPKNLPAVEQLKWENIFVMDDARAKGQDIRPLRIAILNLMPVKDTTETDFVRILSNSPLQVELEFMKIGSHESRHTAPEHMSAFYHNFDEMRKHKYDGFIVTGAPLEHMPFEEVTYWDELREVFNWAHSNVTSTLYICWASQAALYHFYGINKYPTQEKVFGIFPHHAVMPGHPLLRGFDDVFYVPHSRHTELRKDDILKHQELEIISESDEAGVHIISARGGREFFITGHSEYSPLTLDSEYRRDVAKGLPIHIPYNYYPDDNPELPPIVRWRSTANLMFTNWLNYFVYQVTPYDIENIC